MKLYNTLTRKVEEVRPLEDDKINMFVCGPTVYDFSHLGHAKTYTQLDVLARVLRAAGFETNYLQNITDIDDKIIQRAAENHENWQDLSRRFEAEYHKDMLALGNDNVSQYARATDYIEDIIRQVQVLLDTGHAYKIDDGIYFEITTFPDYGKLSGRREVQKDDAESRIDHSDEKRGWNDFCLWKFKSGDDPSWPAPFGEGRPGWHIEDTAITEHFFGPQYDIHGGAIDLIFPHHEAEITQMESASGKVPFVGHWVHTGFLTIDGAKMSKSLKNFYTIREVLDKGYDPMAVRLFMLQSHYRSGINFTWDALDAANNRLKALRAWADLRHQTTVDVIPEKLDILFKNLRAGVQTALEDDLNTPAALTCFNDIMDYMATIPIPGLGGKYTDGTLGYLDSVLGLGLNNRPDINGEQKQIIKERETARSSKDWPKSDQLRAKLEEQGLALRDTPYGPIWNRL